MTLSYLEYLKNKNNINSKINNLASDLLQENSQLAISKGYSNNSGTISDLNFLNAQQAVANKNNLDAEKINNSKQYNSKQNQYNLAGIKGISDNTLSILAAPATVKGAMDGLYEIANSGALDNSLSDLLPLVKKAERTVKNIFKGLF